MKKLATLLLAAGMVFGAATGASAIDFSAKGQWIMSFDGGHGSAFINRSRGTANDVRHHVSGWGNHGQNKGSKDSFSAQQRVRLWLNAVASESLSGTVGFEIGNVWGDGNNDAGGALGADGKTVKVKHAYIDWIVPETDLKVRMGIQPLALPDMVFEGSEILDDDVAAIVLSNRFNDNVSLTAFWARPYNDNYDGVNEENLHAGYEDNVDLAGLVLPLTFDGVKVTPWAMLGFIGPNTFSKYDKEKENGKGLNTPGNAASSVLAGTLPAVAAYKWDKKGPYGGEYATGVWAGLTGEVTMWDPFRLAWDVNFGGVWYDQKSYDRAGWYAALLGEYKMDWGTPGLYAWYSSGDDSNVKNGSERMATIRANGANQVSNFALTGDKYIGRDGLLGMNLVGTWGVGARVKDFSFLEDLKHTFRVNYFNGTNSPTMAKYILGKKYYAPGDKWSSDPYIHDFNGIQDGGLYLTTQDSALEFGLTSTYKIYENLLLNVEADYIALFLDESRSVWGHGSTNEGWITSPSTTDAWNVNVSFVYSF